MQDSKNLVRHELIGLEIEVINSKNPSLDGIKGKIIEETKNTLKIKTKNKMKIVNKNQVTLKTNFKGKITIIDGSLLVGRPEDRIKK